MKGISRFFLLLLTIVLIVFLIGILYWLFRCQCTGIADVRGRPAIMLQEAAASVWDDRQTLGVQLQLVNIGGATAHDVRVATIAIDGGAYAGLATLPLAVGDLAALDDAIFDAILKLNAPADGRPRVLRVAGDYKRGVGRTGFDVSRTIFPNSAPPGPFASMPGTFVKQDPQTASYPVPPPLQASEGPNADSPIFVPIGPSRQIFPPTPTGTALGTAAGGALVEIPVNTSLTNAGVPPDSNAAAAANGVVMATYNTGVSVSTDGGATFTDVGLFVPQPGNPARSSFFPQSDGGLCCDQVVVYLVRQNLFVWLLQYNPITACATNCPPQPPPATPATFSITQTSRLRIAWATPEAIATDFWNAWTYGDLTGVNTTGVSSGLGIANNEWLDYPDLAWSDDFLYVGIDHGATTPGQVWLGRRIVARLSLADMNNATATTVGYNFTELTGSNGLNKTHFVQGAPGRMVVGSLDNSSTLRVYTWLDSAGTFPSPATVSISQIPQGANYTSTAPDGSDWVAVGFPGNITGGAFRSVGIGLGAGLRDEYLMAFTAGQNPGGGRPRAYVRLETLTPDGGGYRVHEEYDIWNPDYAFAMAGLGPMFTEIGITLGVGGGTIGIPQHAVGFKDDFVVFQVTNSDATQVSRFGDYFSNRWIPATGKFASEVYDVILNPLPPGVTSGTCSTVGCSAVMRYVEYQRPPPPPIN